jgi:membrane-associated HD superfamily phosphohydrolase
VERHDRRRAPAPRLLRGHLNLAETCLHAACVACISGLLMALTSDYVGVLAFIFFCLLVLLLSSSVWFHRFVWTIDACSSSFQTVSLLLSHFKVRTFAVVQSFIDLCGAIYRA